MLTTTMPLVMLAIWHAVAARGAGRALRSARVHRLLPRDAGRAAADQHVGRVADVDGDPRRHAVGYACCARSTRCSPTAPSTWRRCRMRALVVLADPRDPRLRGGRSAGAPRSGAAGDLRGVAAGRVAADLLHDGAARRARVLHRERARRVRAVAGRPCVFSGYLIPLELLPPWIGGAARVLPFRYMLGFPVEMLIGLADPRGGAARSSPCSGATSAFSSRCALLVWRAGVRRFAAYGG